MNAHVNTDSTSRVGALIRAHRLRIGLTQRELADLSTISVRAIRDLEQGKARRPRPDTVRLMADALRLGPRARAALEAAAQQGRAGGQGWGRPPAPPTALHAMSGRDAETAVLERELSVGGERLVNVVGFGGVGKTRVALEVAERLHAAGVPVLWHAFPGASADHLGCAEPESAARVAATVADLYGPPPAGAAYGGGGAGAGAFGEGAGGGLFELLGDQRVLLVLDGAPAVAPRFDRLTALLRACPGLRVLVTSERPWEVPGERIFLLSPLEVPAEGAAPDAAAAAPAVRLFLDHVRRVRPEFTAGPADLARAARLCRRLDGHPGALAAAASWLVVCDLTTLCLSLDADPVALLDHLGGGAGADRFRAALRSRTDGLSAGARELLDALCAGETEDAGAEFGLTDVAALTGRGLPESGRMLRELLISGTVRAAPESGGSRFRVLSLVRAATPRTPQRA
ncbi:XRE family transcriptional regulator [Streptomyces lavendulae subsp. lavendulae]|uniref:helix-turn-helix domain-containing protein n=1 Tax=Streptomyces lavendulae TaxID=1914 RepID=UPI00249FC82B|nr:helix-turn-helix domain-containing protein [Streptomyces lavendulae]GLV86884.1 XRE family transcriptional regulator [Streptomyces lavendulae subsp. lavendulae]